MRILTAIVFLSLLLNGCGELSCFVQHPLGGYCPKDIPKQQSE